MADNPTSFPRQHARTQRFTLGEPRNVVVSPDGHRVVFLRSSRGDDPVNALWVFDVATATERLVADPKELALGTRRESGGDVGGDVGDDDLPPAGAGADANVPAKAPVGSRRSRPTRR